MKRGEVYWADLPPPAGRRPVLIVTRTSALRYRAALTIAPVTRRIRGIPSEVPVGASQGLHHESVANCDSLLTVDKRILGREPAGVLSRQGIRQLDKALRYALGIRY
jgi:mRNA interferase MazF